MRNGSVTALLSHADSLQQQGDLSEAIAQYRRAIELNPHFSWSHHYLGEALARQQDWEGARVAYEQAIRISPNSFHSHYGLGRVLSQQGRLDEAIASYQRTLELNPDFPECHDSMGRTLAKQGKIEEAIASYRKALDRDPNAAETYLHLGQAQLQQDRVDEAVASFEKSLQINPGNWETYQSLAEIWQSRRQWAEAAEAYEKAIKLNPNWASSHHKLGNVLEQLGRWDAAIESYSKALQLAPNAAVIHHNLGHALAKVGNLNEGIEHYRKAIALNPESVILYTHLGDALHQKKAWEEAVNAYSRALELDPTLKTARQKLDKIFLEWGQNCLKSGDREAAIAVYRRAIQRPDCPPQIYEKLGDILRESGTADREEMYRHYREAFDRDSDRVEAAKKALELQPEDADLYKKLADTFVKKRQFEAAIALYDRLLLTQPKNLDLHLQQGDIWVKAGALDKAIGCYQKILQIDPNFARAYHHLGEPLQKQGKLEEAIAAYQKAIELDPSFFGSYHNLGDLLRQRKQSDKAAEAYQKATQLNPKFYWSYHNLADVLEEKGKAKEAIAAYRKALKINPNFAYSHKNLGTLLVKQGEFEEAIVHLSRAAKLDPSLGIDTQALQTALLPKPAIADPMYSLWREQNEPRPADLKRMAETMELFRYRPVISIILPVYNTPDPFLRDAIDSILNQIYPHWELCIADDASTLPAVRSTLEEYAAKDSRIKIAFRTENGHISAASNSALEVASGEFISLLDHDDTLTPDALYEVALFLNRHPDADLIYSDEDKITPDGQLINPYFKPEWSPESFLSRMYTCHLGTYRRSLVEEIGGWRVGYEGAQDYDLVLRFTEKTDKIHHIPKVLYHWRMHSGSAAGGTTAKPYAYKASEKALQDAIARRGEKGTVSGIPDHLGHHLVRYQIRDYKKVSIIIPTRNLGRVLDRCLESIFAKSTYPNYEVIVIDNGSTEAETHQVFEKWSQKEPSRFKCYPLNVPFNFSKINNYGVGKATGDYLLFLNNDTEVITPDWIEGMVEQVQRPAIGAIGALLLFSDRTIQHAGIVMGLGGAAGHSYYRMTSDMPGYFGNLIGFNNVSAVTGACLMCRRAVFNEVGGFDEKLTVAYNDVDLCLKMLDRGYRNLYLPHVTLYHHESKSRGYEDSPEKKARLRRESQIIEQRWSRYIENDPYYSPHLTRVCQNYSLRV